MSTRSQRQNAKNDLVKKFWGNATMGNGSPEKVATFTDYQCARKESWMHGMQQGFLLGLRMGRK